MEKTKADGSFFQHFQLSELTNRIEVAHTTRKRSEGQSEKWSFDEISNPSKKQNKGKPIEDPTLQLYLGNLPVRGKGADAGGEAGVGQKPVWGKGADAGGEPEKPKKSKNDPNEASWRNLYTIKTKLDAALAAAYGLTRKADGDADWTWMKSIPEYDPMARTLTEFEKLSSQHKFWSDAQIVSNMRDLKAKHSDQIMKTEFAARSRLILDMVSRLTSSTETIKRMVAARSNV